MKKIIGLGGVARSGKDTFAGILSLKLLQAGKKVRRVAFADPLKTQVDEFLIKNLGITAFTPNSAEKTLIRPMLVWYGDAQRKRTNGRYWIDIAKKAIEESDYEYYIITDVRYSFYEKDELYFLKNEMSGTLCHISKYEWKSQPQQYDDITGVVHYKEFVAPANDHEQENDPKIKQLSDYRVEWPHINDINPDDLLWNPELNEHVDKFMEKMRIV
jgi:hypothetical protein